MTAMCEALDTWAVSVDEDTLLPIVGCSVPHDQREGRQELHVGDTSCLIHLFPSCAGCHPH